MRHFRTAALVFSLAPLAGFAQSDEETPEETAPEGSHRVVNPAAQHEAPPPKSAGRDSANAQHTVERGDTLWDLSQRYLGSPWYWPKVWSYNPEIANPHWIYPGNLVRFFQNGEEVPTQVEVGQPEGPDVDEGQLFDTDDRVQLAGQIGYKQKGYTNVMLPGFVTPGEVEGSGRIEASFAETDGISFPQSFYVRFKRQPKLGETYVVFRSGHEVSNPATGDSVGFLTTILGEARVTRIEKNNIGVMQIVRQVEDIHRGDLLGPSGEPLIKQVSARAADRDIKEGHIISMLPTFRVLAAEHSLLIVDRGSEHGVKVGNVFSIWRRHDALPQEVVLNPTIENEELPREDIGSCIVMEAKSRASVCLVSRSLREFVPGDHAEIRARGGARAER